MASKYVSSKLNIFVSGVFPAVKCSFCHVNFLQLYIRIYPGITLLGFGEFILLKPCIHALTLAFKGLCG